jgi:hypothetical protein
LSSTDCDGEERKEINFVGVSGIAAAVIRDGQLVEYL